MKQTTFNMFFLLLNTFLYSIYEIIHRTPKAILPKTLNDYSLVRVIKSKFAADLANGIYRNRKNKYVFVKYWTGKFRNYNYNTLKNEAQILFVATKFLDKNSPEKFKNIRIPKLLQVIENENSLFLITEYIQGSNISKLSRKKQFKIYKHICEYLDYLSTKMNNNHKKLISARYGYHYIVLYILLFIKAVLMRPSAWRLLSKGIPIVFSNVAKILALDTQTLVHRDLTMDNIMYEKNKYYIIDFQLSVMTNKLLEYITTLGFTWNKKRQMHIHFIKDVLNPYLKKHNNSELLKPLIIIAGTHKLIGTNFSSKRINDFKQFIQFGINL